MTHTSATITVHAVDYYDRFQCLGAECPDTCCQGWDIAIENSIRDMYRDHDSTHGTALADSLITTDRGTLMQFGSDGYCPHLNAEKLCGIYGEIGPHGQSQICDTYPRGGIHYQVPHVELTTSLSCPVSVEEGVFREAPLQRKRIVTNDPQRLKLSEIRCGDESGFNYLKTVRDLFIRILQRREFSLNRRLMAVLLVAHRFRSVDYQSNLEALQSMHKQLEELLAGGVGELPELAANQANQFSILVQLSQTVIANIKQSGYAYADVNKQLLSIFDESFAGLGVRNFDQLTTEHVQMYVSAQQTYVSPWLAERPHIVENLFVHHFMSTGFPFTTADSIVEQLLVPVINQLIMLGLLGGYAHYHGGLNDEMVKKQIYLFSRVISHSAELKKALLNASQQLGGLELGALYTLFAR